MKKPEDIKKGLECCATTDVGDCEVCPYKPYRSCRQVKNVDTLALIQQLEDEKKQLQERICNQRRSLALLHAMYEWALGRLQKHRLNDRANFQHWLWERGYDLSTMELPESRIEKERNAAFSAGYKDGIKSATEQREKLVAMLDEKIIKLEARNDTLVAKATLYDEAIAAGVKMQRERDAAVKDIPHTCKYCANESQKWLKEEYPRMNDICCTCIGNDRCNWKWRGEQENPND